MSPFLHAQASAKKFGGQPEDYMHVHAWIDESKGYHPDFRHRALRHHAEGIILCAKVLGESITLSTGKKVPTRLVAEQHVIDDLGFIPTVSHWLAQIAPAPWMSRPGAPHPDKKRRAAREPGNEKAESETP